MKVAALAFTFSLFSSVALAAEGGMDGQPRGNDFGGGYGRNNPRGVEGGAFNGPTSRPGMCNRCDQIDYDNPQSVTDNGHSWNGSVGVSERGFGINVGINSGNKTTTYGRTDRGVNADGDVCSCSGGGFGGQSRR